MTACATLAKTIGRCSAFEFEKPNSNHPEPLLDDPASTNGHAVAVPVVWFDVARIDEPLEQNTGSDRAAALSPQTTSKR
ncbi:hypothetical protein [Mesorhizobium sophorae]|uniref:hypothetical protein n=1 Tax=Mesorhizobium sophorae TaxID=1300294 RepID=UPI000BA2FEE0|nr:hypothetical protein [Mesorhizobium sophorae]